MVAMAGFNIIDTAKSSVEFMGLGDTVWVQDSCWQHVVANGAILKGDLVVITNAEIATSATNTNALNNTGIALMKQFGIAQYAFADTERGLVLVGPFERNPVSNFPFTVNCEAGAVQSGLLYTSAVAGRISNVATSAARIQNLALVADTVAGPALTACRAVDRITAAGG